MSNLSKYIIFKPVPGGYVYRIPNAWVFGSGVHLLVDERQKAAIIRTMDSVPLFPIIAAWWVTLSIVFGTVALWAARSLSHNVLIATSVLLSIYGALFISRRVLLSRLRPVLAGLPKTDERITSADKRSSTPPAVLSPTRLRILKVCLGLMPFILMAPGSSSFRTSIFFASSSVARMLTPVMLLPGLARLAASPESTAIIFSFVIDIASTKVCIGVFPKHQRQPGLGSATGI
jgi:hypothetical protein